LLLGHKIDIFHEPILVEIAHKHKKTVAQVVLNYLLSKNIVVIPKSERAERIKENFHCFDFKLDHEDNNKIKTLDKGLRCIDTYIIPSWHGVPAFD